MPDARVDGRPEGAAVDPDVEALLPYAELLREVVDRRLRPSTGTALVAPSTDRLFDDALPVVMERMLADRLRELEPAAFAELYRQVRGDDAFAAALDAVAASDRETLERRAQLARMAREAAVSGRVLLGELTAGEVLTIGLFDPTRPDLAARRFRDNQQVRPLHRVLQVRLTDPDRGRVAVVLDTWTGALWSEDLRGTSAPPHAIGSVGTPAVDGGLHPELVRHAPLTLRLDDGDPVAPVQIVGYVETLDGRVLLDG